MVVECQQALRGNHVVTAAHGEILRIVVLLIVGQLVGGISVELRVVDRCPLAGDGVRGIVFFECQFVIVVQGGPLTLQCLFGVVGSLIILLCEEVVASHHGLNGRLADAPAAGHTVLCGLHGFRQVGEDQVVSLLQCGAADVLLVAGTQLQGEPQPVFCLGCVWLAIGLRQVPQG